MKNVEIKKALKDELKYYDDYKIFIRWFEDCDNTSFVEISTLIDEDKNEWGEGYYIDGLDELKGYDELSENEIKEIQKKMKQIYNYLKKHFYINSSKKASYLSPNGFKQNLPFFLLLITKTISFLLFS